MKPYMHRIAKPGDMLTPIVIWNSNAVWSGYDLAAQVKCIAVDQHSFSQSGVQYLVESLNGTTHWLDSAWFELVGDNDA